MSRFWYGVILAGYTGLFGVLMLWFTWLEPSSLYPVSLVLIVLVGPLLFPLHGLLNGRTYTCVWTSYLALFYFLVGMFNLAGAMARPWLAWLEIAFSLLLFLGVVMYVYTYPRKKRHAGN